MAGRPDPNATQPLSGSQVVSVTPTPPTGMNDQSIAWRGKVVSADEFATTPAKRSHTGAIALALVAIAGLGGGAYYYFAMRSAPAATAPAASAPPAVIDAGIAAKPAVAAKSIDAAVATPPPSPVDAAIAAAPAPAVKPAAKPIHKKHAIRHHK